VAVKLMTEGDFMMSAIQFESVVNNGIIKIPEQYMNSVPSVVHVTLIDACETRLTYKPKTKERPLSIDEFSDLKLDTRNWKFDREEANERR
jgi:hypothetical protein